MLTFALAFTLLIHIHEFCRFNIRAIANAGERATREEVAGVVLIEILALFRGPPSLK